MIADDYNLEHILFTETQHFRQAWVMLMVFAIAGLQWVVAVSQLVLGIPFGQNPMSNNLLLIYWMAFGIGMPILFFLYAPGNGSKEGWCVFSPDPISKIISKNCI
jgi:hypothetical protein